MRERGCKERENVLIVRDTSTEPVSCLQLQYQVLTLHFLAFFEEHDKRKIAFSTGAESQRD